MKVSLYLSHHCWENALCFGKCQSARGQRGTSHGKAIGSCLLWIGGDAVFVQHGFQRAALCILQVGNENILLPGQAQTRAKLLDHMA